MNPFNTMKYIYHYLIKMFPIHYRLINILMYTCVCHIFKGSIMLKFFKKIISSITPSFKIDRIKEVDKDIEEIDVDDDTIYHIRKKQSETGYLPCFCNPLLENDVKYKFCKNCKYKWLCTIAKTSSADPSNVFDLSVNETRDIQLSEGCSPCYCNEEFNMDGEHHCSECKFELACSTSNYTLVSEFLVYKLNG